MQTVHSPAGIKLLMEDLWLRHRNGIGRHADNIFMVELPPLTRQEQLTHDEADLTTEFDSDDDLYGAWI